VNYANSTFTDKLIVLKKWCDWVLGNGFIPNNPITNVKYKKGYKKINLLRQPQVMQFKDDQFKSPLARYNDSAYYAPIKFTLFTRCRKHGASKTKEKSVR
jgi:hypothetical protein